MSPWPRLTGTLPLAPPDHEEFSLLLSAFCLACVCVWQDCFVPLCTVEGCMVWPACCYSSSVVSARLSGSFSHVSHTSFPPVPIYLK